MEIQEIIRRWQAGHSQRQIAAGTGLSRDTVRKYLSAVQGEGIARDGPAPDEIQLSRLAVITRSGPRQSEAPGQDLLEPWGDQIYWWLTVERLQMTRIRELLAPWGCPVSYPSLRRFILKRNWRKPITVTVRMGESVPGEVAELDFGRLGFIQDRETGRRCAVWALLVVLAYSRAHLPVARLRPEAGGGDRWPGGGLVFLRRHSQIPGHRQLPRRSGGSRRLAPASDPRLPGILPAPGLHHRSGPGASPQRQAHSGAQRPVRQGALLQGRRVQGSEPPPF